MTDGQARAVQHQEGPLLVVAGPGSGKTSVIVGRVAHLISKVRVKPASLLVVTFTRAAADLMKARATELLGPGARQVTFGTFHALAYRILRGYEPDRSLRILQEGEQIGLVRQQMQGLSMNTDDETVLQALGELTRFRSGLGHEGFTPRGIHVREFQRLADGYARAKSERDLLDFDDLLHGAVALLRERPEVLKALRDRYHYVMVDEFQDTNPVQWELLKLLASPRENLCAVGDDDQAVYGWRGASPAFMLHFLKAYPGARQVTLGLNHRCPPAVVAAANRLAQWNRQRLEKEARSARSDGGTVELLRPADSLREAEYVVQLVKRSGEPLSDWAVIFRTNQQAHVLAQELERAGLAYRVLGGLPNLYRRWPVQDLLSYLRAASGDLSAVEQVINRPNRYISRTVLQEARSRANRSGSDLLTAIAQTGLLRSWQLRPLEELADHLRRMQLLPAPDAMGYARSVVGYDDYLKEYCEREGGSAEELTGLLDEVQRTSPPVPILRFLAQVEAFAESLSRRETVAGDAVTLTTCHSAKGLEFRNVVVVGAVDRVMPHRGSTDQEEERRLMYVAMTRSAERLWISAPATFGGRDATPSPFVTEALGQEALERAGLEPDGGKADAKAVR